MKGIVASVLSLISISTDRFEDIFWRRLVESEIDPRSIVVFLCYVVKVKIVTIGTIILELTACFQASTPKSSTSTEGLDETIQQTDSNCALLAATIYFALLRIPGSRNKVFTSLSFRTIMKVLLPASKSIKSSKAKNTIVVQKRKRNDSDKKASAVESKRSTRPCRACRSQATSIDNNSEVRPAQEQDNNLEQINRVFCRTKFLYLRSLQTMKKIKQMTTQINLRI